MGHEIPTALLPPLLTSTLGAPASALGAIEGISDALASVARFTGGALADDPHRRRTVAVGGYTTTALFSASIGAATAVWQVAILRATELFEPGRSQDQATQLALWLYVAYNLAATLISLPAGHLGDRIGAPRVLALGALSFVGAYVWFAAGPDALLTLLPAFVLAGLGIGFAETAEHAAVAALAPADLRGSAFGMLAGIQSIGNLVASLVAGILWTAGSPGLAFSVLTVTMAVAVPLVLTAASVHSDPDIAVRLVTGARSASSVA